MAYEYMDKKDLPPSAAKCYLLSGWVGAFLLPVSVLGMLKLGETFPQTLLMAFGQAFGEYLLATGKPIINLLTARGIISEYELLTGTLLSYAYFAAFGMLAGLAVCFVIRYFTPRKIVVQE